MQITDILGAISVIPVVKIENAQHAVPLCKALKKGGLPTAEITFRTAAAADAIAALREQLPAFPVGAGTITDIAQADEAISAGALYIVTPGFNPKVVLHCIEKGVPVYPGCPTSSDIEAARELGLKVVKFFPAEAMGGIKTIKALSAPYADMRFIPTGGINESNLGQYLASSKVIACGGSWMVPSDMIEKEDFTSIERLTRGAVQAAHGFRIHHVAFNCGSADAGAFVADAFSRLFGWEHIEGDGADHAGTWIEAMKIPCKGTTGHIAVAVNDIPRAKAYMQMRGVHFEEQTQPQVCWMTEEIMGFGLQIVDPKLM